jgi:hypothetical protein
MKINHVRFIPIVMGVITAVSGCAGVVPGSRPYTPLPKFEAKFFGQAKRDVFPDDVRKQPERFKDVLVVWTGIIRSVDYHNDGMSRVARITAEHVYFDWIEDFGIQHERFFLSPRGEGLFAAAWRIESPSDQQFIEQCAVGDLLIAYGKPSLIKDKVVGLFPTENIRGIKPEWFRRDILDYGRPGEPVKYLKTPL